MRETFREIATRVVEENKTQTLGDQALVLEAAMNQMVEIGKDLKEATGILADRAEFLSSVFNKMQGESNE